MPVQTPQWCDLLCCCICYNVFDGVRFQPVSLVCGHTACRSCLLKLKSKQCPFDQSAINIPVADLPQNMPILRILDCHEQVAAAEGERSMKLFEQNDLLQYHRSAEVLDILALYLRRAQSEKGGSVWSPQLSRPMQRKLVTLLCCQVAEPEGRGRAMKAIRSLGERSLMELLLLHQNPYHLSSNLWAAVRARGCQFLGPAMQEEVLKLVLLALSEGALISRKVLVMYIVQTLEKDYPQASKTSVGHVVQLLYRASCFNVIKRDGESSLMQLKEEFRNYEALRREHDAQIVQIAMEAGLRISPDQWSALLYGDQAHKSHMQSIIDRLQTPQSFVQSIQELLIGLQRTGDPGALVELRPHYELLADIDAAQGETIVPTWNAVVGALMAVKAVIEGQVRFCERYGGNKNQRDTIERSVVAYKFKTSMCRDIGESKTCPRGDSCTFAHSLEEMERYRARSRLMGYRSNVVKPRNAPDAGGCARASSTDGNRSDNEFDFGFDESERIDGADEKHRDPAIVGAHMTQQQLPSLRQSPVVVPSARRPLTQSVPIPVFPPPTAFQTAIDDATTATPVIMNTPPTHFGPGGAALMMQWPSNAAIVNTPTGPLALGSAQPGSLSLGGAAVRYQLFRHGGATCPPPAPTQPLPAPVPVAPAPPEYSYYWYPQAAANIQPRTGIYHPGDVLHMEMPLARVVPAHQIAANANLTTAGGMTATAVAAGGHYPGAVAAFTEVPSGSNNAAAQTANVTPFVGNYTYAQPDAGAVYFYPSPQDHQNAPAGALPAAASGQFGVYLTPGLDDVLVYSPPHTASASSTTNGMIMSTGNGQSQKEQYQQHQTLHRSVTVQMETKHVTSCSTAVSCASNQMVVSSSSNKTTLSSCVAPSTSLKSSGGETFTRNKEDTEKHSRLLQLEMKKDEIIKRLTSIKKESLPSTKQPQPQHLSRYQREESLTDSRLQRSSSESDQADSLSASIATSVLQDDYPAVNYAAAVLRGRQVVPASGTTLPLQASLGVSYTNGALDGGWSSLASSVAAIVSSGPRGAVPPCSASLSGPAGCAIGSKRSTSADSSLGISSDYSTPWKGTAPSASGSNAWSQTKTVLTSTNGTGMMTKVTTQYVYATRPYIPSEYIDIKHLTDDVLRKEMEQLPPTSKRLHYVRLELEAREADSWRSEDDQVIPFSTCGPQVSRYGPISRASQRMQATAVSAAPSDGVVQVKDILHQPLPTATVQPTKEQPVVSRNHVDPSQIVSTIPQVFKVSAATIDPSTVEEKFEKLVEVKSKLASIPLEEGASSSAEKEQLKLELDLINKEISMMDDRKGEEYLLKALENVNLTIEELQQQKRQVSA